MLLPAERLLNTPVMSLQTGGRLAQTKTPVIDPRNLSILAYELDGPSLDQHPSFLRVEDIREISSLGLIVDSSDEFVGLEDIIKLKEVYDFSFELLGKSVRDKKGKKIGKVIGYSIEPGSFLVKQLNVRRPLLKSFNDTELLIDRTQIIEVSDESITIKSEEVKPPAHVKRVANTYTNPFRTTQAQPETIHRD